MIYSIRGKLESIQANAVVIETAGGVGYFVFTTPATMQVLAGKDEVHLYTLLQVRDDALELYGFASEEELRFFQLLKTVSGIGPKAALAILGVADIATLQSAIASGRSELLSKAGGVGKKTSERIIVELKEKVGKGNEEVNILERDFDIIEALKSLGYSVHEARNILKDISPEVADFSERLKTALKMLGKK
ncbi:MAG: Holliday junction branch migration protein RuvA [Patescibacteria group bacterium]|nr:Holliday junction branch migration protein RuvA [Patescibacteria group bacterium]MDE2438464.1 Holliday junction branch migration protein RuvA [Patescibacteria group bacterium]